MVGQYHFLSKCPAFEPKFWQNPRIIPTKAVPFTIMIPWYVFTFFLHMCLCTFYIFFTFYRSHIEFWWIHTYTSRSNDNHPLKLLIYLYFINNFTRRRIFYDIFTSLYSLIWNICSRVRKIDRCEMLRYGIYQITFNGIVKRCVWQIHWSISLFGKKCILYVHKCVAATFFRKYWKIVGKRERDSNDIFYWNINFPIFSQLYLFIFILARQGIVIFNKFSLLRNLNRIFIILFYFILELCGMILAEKKVRMLIVHYTRLIFHFLSIDRF